MAGPRTLLPGDWLPASARPSVAEVFAALEADGDTVRFVGGCVRDALLGQVSKRTDLDLTTPARPDKVQRLLERAGLRALPTGVEHGTITAVAGDRQFEITTLRRDLRTDGRHAEVVFTDDFAVDAARRDFTINAMSLDRTGRLFDYFGGEQDLYAGRVRFVGVAGTRVAEDYLRILRFFRFFARFGRAPADPLALAACASGAAGLEQLSGERIRSEMLRLLATARPMPSLRLMAETGVLGHVMPLPLALPRLEQLLAQPDADDPLLRLAALIRPPPGPENGAATLAKRWRLSREERERLALLCSADLVTLQETPSTWHASLHRLGAATFADLARLTAAESTRFDPSPAARSATGARLAQALEATKAWAPKTLPVGGRDLQDLGARPGPALGALLRALEAWWVERDFAPDRDACLAEARARLEVDGEGDRGGS